MLGCGNLSLQMGGREGGRGGGVAGGEAEGERGRSGKEWHANGLVSRVYLRLLLKVLKR